MTLGFFTIGEMRQRLRSVASLAVAMVLSIGATHPLTLNMYLAIAFPSVLVPWLLGFLWSRRTGAAEAAAAQRAAAQAAVAEERLRLARELHDVVSHNVGMIAVQAGAADVLMDKNPARSRESLRAIEGGARDTLLELRRLLGLLREDDPDPRAALGPSLSQLGRIVTPASAAGVDVELCTDGDPVPLAGTVEVTAYRIVQEALTNAVAHAGPCRVTVTLGYRRDALDVEVTDDGRAAGRTTRGGYGLVGLRERVTALGGIFEAGPRAGDGFRVHARLPVAD
jgi:signal transduction histidine kinase